MQIKNRAIALPKNARSSIPHSPSIPHATPGLLLLGTWEAASSAHQPCATPCLVSRRSLGREIGAARSSPVALSPWSDPQHARLVHYQWQYFFTNITTLFIIELINQIALNWRWADKFRWKTEATYLSYFHPNWFQRNNGLQILFELTAPSSTIAGIGELISLSYEISSNLVQRNTLHILGRYC